jgi:hypothetical protein
VVLPVQVPDPAETAPPSGGDDRAADLGPSLKFDMEYPPISQDKADVEDIERLGTTVIGGEWQLPDYSPELQDVSDVPNIRFGSDHGYATEHMKMFLMGLGTMPGTRNILVRDISREGGGKFKPHGSHQTGIDADISYPTLGGDYATRKRRFSHKTKSLVDKIDYDRLMLMTLYGQRNGAKMLIMDKEYIAKLDEKAQEWLNTGRTNNWPTPFTRAEYSKIFRKWSAKHPRHPGRYVGTAYELIGDNKANEHRNHVHLRVRTPGWRDKNANGRVDPGERD